MDPTTEILLPDEVWSRIFKHINPKTLMKLRNVSVELMNLIEKFGGWKTLFFDSSTLAPWRNQLCEMYDPKLTSNEYNSQPDSFYKKLIAFYFSWKSLGNAAKQRIVIPSDKYGMNDKCDSDGNYLAFHSLDDKLYIIDENTLDLVAGPISLPESENESRLITDIKIWRPQLFDTTQKRKFFVILLGHNYMLIWDVDEKVYRPIPDSIEEIYRGPLARFTVKRLFRSENEILIEMDRFGTGNFDIAKLIWDQDKKKINARIVFAIKNQPGSSYRTHYLQDVYTENSKIMVVFHSENNFYFTQAEILEESDEPRVMSFLNDSAQFKQIFHDCHSEHYKVNIKIHNSYVVTAYDERDFYVALKTETQNRRYDFITKSIHGPDRFLQISNCVFKFDVLFILTKQGKLRVYTFKNINHLFDIDLFTDRVKEIETDVSSRHSVLKLMTRNHTPYTLIFSWAADIVLLTF